MSDNSTQEREALIAQAQDDIKERAATRGPKDGLAKAIAQSRLVDAEIGKVDQRRAELEQMRQQNLGQQAAYAELALPAGMTPREAMETDHDGLREAVEKLLAPKQPTT